MKRIYHVLLCFLVLRFFLKDSIYPFFLCLMSKHYSLYIKNNDFLCSPNLFHSQADYYYHITKMDTAVAAAALIPKIFQSSCRGIMQELKHPQLKCEP